MHLVLGTGVTSFQMPGVRAHNTAHINTHPMPTSTHSESWNKGCLIPFFLFVLVFGDQKLKG
jgi:hypothetical protein